MLAQVEKAGPRIAAASATSKKFEREIAELTAQLTAAGLQPLPTPAVARCHENISTTL